MKNINLDGTLNLKNASEFETYNNLASPNSKRDFFKENASRLEAESTTQATIKLLKFLSPKIFFIENPQASRIFKYINNFLDFKTINNVLHYNAYSPDFPKKPSIFASNLEFNTKITKQKSNKKITELGNYNARSAIPENLILDLTKQAKEQIWMKKKLTNYTK